MGERVLDASGNDKGRLLGIQATRQWGRMVLVGEGGSMAMMPSRDMIHDQKTLYGSWVTSIWRMEELVERLARWKIHPESLITHRFPLEKADEAYALMASGNCGKVAVAWAVRRGQVTIPQSCSERNIRGNLIAATVISARLTEQHMKKLGSIDKGCRLVKGQVFCWKKGQDWRDLWDQDGKIVS